MRATCSAYHGTSSNVDMPNITPRLVGPELFVDVYDRAPFNIPTHVFRHGLPILDGVGSLIKKYINASTSAAEKRKEDLPVT
jgi:hypothetical protein